MIRKVIFVDFYPAELKENKDWVVVYHVLHPQTKEMRRKRVRVKPLEKISDRRKLGKRIVIEINKRLENGWNPFYQNKGTRELALLQDAMNVYKNRITQEASDGNLRADTQRTYHSQLQQLLKYLKATEQDGILCYAFNADFIGEYLDYVRYTRKLSAKTRDNYLSWLTTFSTFLLQKKYIVINPTTIHAKINKKKKNRILIDKETRDLIFDYWLEKDLNYQVLCLLCYYCLVRRTEITKIKVGNVNFKKQTLYISATEAKNRKNAFVTIPDKLIEPLKMHVNNADTAHYLFSKNGGPGKIPLTPNSITKRWSWMRTKLGIDKNIHWYSLKDSGITDLLRAGVPLISVRDHARHFSSGQTDSYTPKEMRQADVNIKESDIKF